MSVVFEKVIEEVSNHLSEAWPEILEVWKDQATRRDLNQQTVALVTHQCQRCDTQVRLGAVFDRTDTQRPPGDRAFCPKCRKVTKSPIVDIHLVENDE